MIFDLVEEVGVESLAIAYNGGKDSIVLQHLVRTTVGMDEQIKLLLWHVADEFPEVIECINNFLEDDGLEIVRFSDSNVMVQDVKQLVEQGNEYIFLGTRMADLKQGEVPEYQKPMWGGGVRVMPLMFFTIQDIGSYLNHFQIPYPECYDQGFTSLGTVRATIRNPFLYDIKTNSFAPAWHLRHPSLERANRAYVNKSLRTNTAAIQCSENVEPEILEIAISEIEARGFQKVDVFDFRKDTKTLRDEFNYVWILGTDGERPLANTN